MVGIEIIFLGYFFNNRISLVLTTAYFAENNKVDPIQ